jgi:hypothetical protein
MLSINRPSLPLFATGPNNVFSRKTFDPALDLDTINKMMFNVIPERDIVPRVSLDYCISNNWYIRPT